MNTTATSIKTIVEMDVEGHPVIKQRYGTVRVGVTYAAVTFNPEGQPTWIDYRGQRMKKDDTPGEAQSSGWISLGSVGAEYKTVEDAPEAVQQLVEAARGHLS